MSLALIYGAGLFITGFASWLWGGRKSSVLAAAIEGAIWPLLLLALLVALAKGILEIICWMLIAVIHFIEGIFLDMEHITKA